MTKKYQLQQERFLRSVNKFGGNPPTFKFDSALERITLVESPSTFLKMLIDDGASLFLKSEGLIVEFYEPTK